MFFLIWIRFLSSLDSVEMGGGGGSWRCKRVARKLFLRTCASFCRDPAAGAIAIAESRKRDVSCPKNPLEISGSANPTISPANKSLCTICLDPLNYGSGGSPGQAIFTAQCSHAFHFGCISSNVQHGSITCPICRAEWTQLPRNLRFRGCAPSVKADPVLQILDDSIANSRLHRRSFLHSARYDDDDPIDSDQISAQPRLQFSLTPAWSHHTCCLSFDSREGSGHCSGSSSRAGSPLAVKDFWGEAFHCSPSNVAYLHVKLGYRPPVDLVLVACPDGPHLRMMKQAMALAVFSLEPGDRLAIVTHSSSAARIFPLRRMTPLGKKTALQVIDRLFYCGQADPSEGLQKGVKILTDRLHMNSQSCILHLTNSSTRSYHLPAVAMVDGQISVHRFHLAASGFGASMGLTMHEFEESLRQMLSGAIRDIQLRIEESCRIIQITELRGGEEQQIPIHGHESSWPLHVSYSYVDPADGGRIRMGKTEVGFEVKGEEGIENADVATVTGRMSSGENWDYYDPFMARRWAKHLHGHRL